MSHCQHKRHRSRSRSLLNKWESQQNRNTDRSKENDRRADSYERHYHSTQMNRQYNHRAPLDQPVSIDDAISTTEEHSPVVQTLIREILIERKKRQLTEARLAIREYDYAFLHAEHEQTLTNMASLKRDYDQCRLDWKSSYIGLNELRHNNHQLTEHIDQFVNDERQLMYMNERRFYENHQRRH